MKTLAGFPKENPHYFLPRAIIEPSEALQAMVFDKVDYRLAKFKRNDGVQEDIAGPNFLKLVKHLLVVFFQDSVLLKIKFPSYYLWNCSLFETSEYKEFDAEVLGSLSEQDEVFLSNQRMRNAMPELVSSVQAGFGTLTTSILSLQTSLDDLKKSNAAEIKGLTTKISNCYAYGNAQFNQPGLVRCVSSASPSQELDAITEMVLDSTPKSSSIIGHNYTLNRVIVSVTDVWREYVEGLGGNPSVKSLEETFRTGWRKANKEPRFFSRRKGLYRAVKDKARKEHISCEEASKKT